MPWWKSYGVCIAILIAAVLIVYARTISYDFVWDDAYFIVRNPALTSWKYVGRYFTDMSTYMGSSDYAPMYRPVRNLAYLTAYSIGGMKPAIFHATNVLLHATNSLLVFWLLLLLLRQIPVPESAQERMRLCALVGAFFWAVQPVQTEAVAWVKGSDELIFSFFYLSCVVLILGAFSQGRLALARVVAIALAFACSLLAKEMAITLPAIALLAWWFFGKAIPPKRMATLVGILGIEVVLFVLARRAVIGANQQCDYIAGSGYAQFLTMIRAGARYVELSFTPGRLIADYNGFEISRSALDHRVHMAALVCLTVPLLAILARRRMPVLSFGLCWFILALLPVSNIVSTMQFLAERFLYLPLVGIAAVVANGTLAVWNHYADTDTPDSRSRLKLVSLLAGTLLVVYMVAAMTRVPVWKNNAALFERTYLDAPPSPRILLNYATSLASQQRYEEAEPVLRQLLTLPNVGSSTKRRALQGLGLCLIARNSLDEGLSCTLTAKSMDPEDPDVLATLGFYYGVQGNHARAMEFYQAAVNRDPYQQSFRANLAVARAMTEKQRAQERLTTPTATELTTQTR